MVHNSVRDYAAGPLGKLSPFSLSSPPPTHSPSICNKRPCLRDLSSLVSLSEPGLYFHSSQRWLASTAWYATKLPPSEPTMAPINKCAFSPILSSPVSRSNPNQGSAMGISLTAAATLPATFNKSALSFILSPPSQSLSERDGLTRIPISTLLLSNRKRPWSTAAGITRRSIKPPVIQDSSTPQLSDVTTSRQGNNSTGEAPPKKAIRLCAVDGCMKLSKHNKRCWHHGGSIKCKVADCDNRAKSKGVCWSHGGGTLCSFETCDTISVSKGFCWAHGGGKRCLVPDCSKPAYERTRNYCKAHFKRVAGAGE